MKQFIRGIIHKLGFDIVPYSDAKAYPPDFDDAERATAEFVKRYTQTSPERIQSVIQSVRYIQRQRIEGAIVECGVWRGGSMMSIARTLLENGGANRDLFLFDTFEGMPPPTAEDVDYQGRMAQKYMDRDPQLNAISLAEVQANLGKTNYPKERVHYVRGKVEDTLPAKAPQNIALLRLDTDWYESTKHELIHLFPRLAPHGVLIIDDYGHFKGCRKAVDEYFADYKLPIMLQRIDYTGRIAIKPA